MSSAKKFVFLFYSKNSKIKYIKAIGGVGKAAKKLITAGKHASKTKLLKEGGKALAGLGGALLGISDIKDNCF